MKRILCSCICQSTRHEFNSGTHSWTSWFSTYLSLQSGDDWLTIADECSWEGVNCTANNTVDPLDLPVDNLKGSILHDLGLLTALATLRLYNNQVTGTVFPDTLDYVPLFENALTGTISSSVSRLTALTFLNNTENYHNNTRDETRITTIIRESKQILFRQFAVFFSRADPLTRNRS